MVDKTLEAQINRLVKVCNVMSHGFVSCNEAMVIMKNNQLKLEEEITELKERISKIEDSKTK